MTLLGGVQCTHPFIVLEALIEYSSVRNKQKNYAKISKKKFTFLRLT